MSPPEPGTTPTWLSELKTMVVQLRDEAILLMLPGLWAAGLLLLLSPSELRQPLGGVGVGGALLFLSVVVWALRRLSYAAAAWCMVFSYVAADLLVVTWGGVGLALGLLALPAGLAALAISRAAGLVVAVACTLLLLFVPEPLLPAGPALRAVSLLGIWGTVGMIWLALRPLFAMVQWAWSGYQRSQALLEETRDYHQRLNQALQELTTANVELTRMNQHSQMLRQIAEDERRIKERFVANVSHELRTPLNMIIGFCEMITQSPESYGAQVPPSLLADLEVVLRNSQHLLSLIDDVLDLSQIEASQMALTRERVPLDELLQAATVAVRPLYASKGLSLETDAPAELPAVYCDRTRIREVLLNLLSNAGRFTERGGVRLRAWQEGDDVVVSTADTGPGISSEDRGRLFQPFHQLDASIRRQYGGTGLGLAISKSLVELHGGRMWIESEPGRGTTVLFRLPIDPPAPPAGRALRWLNPYLPYEERPRRSSGQLPVRPRWVVAESGAAARKLLARHLDGAEIVPAADLEQAVDELRRLPARALLVNDLRVEEALRRVSQRAELPVGVPVIICSIPGAEQAAGALGAADYLVKPISREALLAALDRLGPVVRTVLVVDDEPDALQLFGRVLMSAERDYRVLRADDGQQALEIMRQDRPDVVLLDLVMPEMDGFQFLAAVSQEPAWRDIPVILISARDPLGQPIVSKSLAVTCREGLSVEQLLECIQALSAILSRSALSADQAPTAVVAG